MKKIFSLFLSSLFFIQDCLGSSCCGSSISMPALISTGEKWKLQTVFSQSQRIFQISSDSQAIKLSNKNQLAVFKTQIKTGYLFENNWQIFSQVNLFDRGVGDLDIGFGKEIFLSEDFKTFIWAKVTVPTGKSIYDIQDPNDEPTGTGFWTPGLGVSLSKTLRTWDTSGSVFIGQGLSQKIKGIKITPGIQSFAQISVGKSIGNWRIGSSVEYQRENGKKIQAETKAEDSYSWPVSMSVSYLNKSDIWTASLTDETLLGPTKNTYLNQGISLSYVKRFF